MPTMLRQDGFRVYFYSNEGHEPPHVHIDHGDGSIKLWLHDAAVARHAGLSAREIGRARRLVCRHRERLLEVWNDYFGA